MEPLGLMSYNLSVLASMDWRDRARANRNSGDPDQARHAEYEAHRHQVRAEQIRKSFGLLVVSREVPSGK